VVAAGCRVYSKRYVKESLTELLLGAFAKLRKATFSFINVRKERPGSHWTDFNEIRGLVIIRYSVEKFKIH
jgi:hypothetical protein